MLNTTTHTYTVSPQYLLSYPKKNHFHASKHSIFTSFTWEENIDFNNGTMYVKFKYTDADSVQLIVMEIMSKTQGIVPLLTSIYNLYCNFLVTP